MIDFIGKNGGFIMSDYRVEETKFGTKTSHPSYGTLAFSRRTGGATPLFGSSIKHRDTIAMTLYHADITRGLHKDSIYGDERIVEVEMSYSQFAEAITSMNMGNGVPVTIRWTEKEGNIPACDFVSKREQFTNEFKERINKEMDDSQILIKEVTELFNQIEILTISDKENVLKKLSKLSQNLECNMDYIIEQFNKQMDKTVMEAKGEIEAFCQNKINSVSSAALVEHKDDILKLENPVDINIE